MKPIARKRRAALLLGVGEALRFGVRAYPSLRRFVLAYGRGWAPPFRVEELDEVLREPLAAVIWGAANPLRDALDAERGVRPGSVDAEWKYDPEYPRWTLRVGASSEDDGPRELVCTREWDEGQKRERWYWTIEEDVGQGDFEYTDEAGVEDSALAAMRAAIEGEARLPVRGVARTE